MMGNVIIVFLSLVGMEVFALYFHKYFMHGCGWNWHESHHIHTDGPFEKNDLYAVCFSFIAAALFIAGSLWWMPLWYMALGFTLYGLLYGFVFTITRQRKMARLVSGFYGQKNRTC